MKALKKFEFKKSNTNAKSVYDWDTLLNGTIWVAKENEDFTCDPKSYCLMLRNQAAKRFLVVKINVEGEEGAKTVTFQSSPMTPEQKKAAVLRAEQRAKDKSAKAERGDVASEEEEGEEEAA